MTRTAIQCKVSATGTLSGNESFSLLQASPWIAPTATGGANVTCEDLVDMIFEQIGVDDGMGGTDWE